MKKNLIIIGAGGHTKSLIDCVDLDEYSIVGILDKNKDNIGKYIQGVQIIGEDKDLGELQKIHTSCVIIGIGHLGNASFRQKIFRNLINCGSEAINIIHNSAILGNDLNIGVGNFISKGAIINVEVTIGDNNIINSGSIIEHEVCIEDNIHIAPGVTICGNSYIESGTLIGAGSTIIQGVHIGHDAIIGAGSVIRNDVESNSIVVGNSQRIIGRI